MAVCELSETLESTFGGVSTMLSGKNPLNMNAFPLLVEKINMSCLCHGALSRYEDITSFLKHICEQSRPTKLWVDWLIQPF